MSIEGRNMFPLVENLVRMVLIYPASACTAERSFSAMKRLKGWSRLTMTHGRINYIMVCYVHRDLQADLKSVIFANEFFCNPTESRLKMTFGKMIKIPNNPANTLDIILFLYSDNIELIFAKKVY